MYPNKNLIENFINKKYHPQEIKWDDEQDNLEITLSNGKYISILFDSNNLDAIMLTGDNELHEICDRLNQLKLNVGLRYIDASDSTIKDLYIYLDSIFGDRRSLAKFLYQYHDQIEAILPSMELNSSNWEKYPNGQWSDEEGYCIDIDKTYKRVLIYAPDGDWFTTIEWSNSDE